ncbi:MAG: bifunctional 3-deoxy-7-phosphoheptulonate synthase/chorismate mutase type II [Bacteroidales bacterium]|nr:bifunctional 3-deoxy-7-phosphoheptulonate synthase/chorismate mutase type II [Bacteroidales bacterium]MDD3989047.1 bifunctional 3-deoxy-7-phosphoheptulonate synthase/chorismate mutase type II [Bacteroidales bacterium]
MNKESENPFSGWDLNNTERPLLIAGPCSAESREQTIKSAIELKEIGIEIFRAGIWKPRTRPNQFEGIGKEGLEWLRTIKSEVGMKVATEVGNVKHVYEALRAGIDIIWIGARTSADPFTIQDIAESLKGVDIPVLVKNPVNPDLNLWIGAIERIRAAGITRIGAIHRGFTTYDKTRYRNIPYWQLAIELRQRMPGIPLLCDPSHMGGSRELIHELSQKALDLNYNGLMIESHCDPQSAASDRDQQVKPSELSSIIKKLVVRNFDPEDPTLMLTIEELRHKIDTYDNKLLTLLEERMKVVSRIGLYKKENHLTILQPSRWKEIMESAVEKGRVHHLSDELVLTLFKAIHQESINNQTKILNN